MKINKITDGYVIQQYDTNTDTWVSQEFISGDGVGYETEEGGVVDPAVMGTPEPYLPFNMTQPTVDVQSCQREIQEQLLSLLDGLVNEEVETAAKQIVIDNFNKFNLI